MKIRTFCCAVLIASGLMAVSAASQAQAWSIGVSVGFPPPALPVYEQPPIPAAGYLWTPGYWGYDGEDEDYYWVPGTWVLAPRPGYLWTPGYWGAEGAYFAFHAGYWGPEVGFYGGINYGFGYFGIGFGGGYWRGDDFCYNRAVANVNNVSITNVYNNTTVVNNQVTDSRVSFNGGREGTHVRPSGSELAAEHAPHLAATNDQLRHESAARAMPALRSAVNHGVPAIAATPKPAAFAGHGLTAARAAGVTPSVPAGQNVARGRVDAGTGRATSGDQPFAATHPAPSLAARRGALSASSQTRPAVDAPRTDRPAWAGRSSPQFASAHSAPASASRPTAQDRPGQSREFQAGARPSYTAASQASNRPASNARDARAPAPSHTSNDVRTNGYAAARAPAQRWTPPANAPPARQYAAPARQYTPPARQYAAPARQYTAPARQYAAREAPRQAYAQHAAAPPRDYGRSQGYAAPHAAASPPPARANSAPHGDGARHGPLHT